MPDCDEAGRRYASRNDGNVKQYEGSQLPPYPMTELTVGQIAATLAGQVGRPESELALLLLFRSAVREPRDVEPEARRETLPQAA